MKLLITLISIIIFYNWSSYWFSLIKEEENIAWRILRLIILAAIPVFVTLNLKLFTLIVVLILFAIFVYIYTNYYIYYLTHNDEHNLPKGLSTQDLWT